MSERTLWDRVRSAAGRDGNDHDSGGDPDPGSDPSAVTTSPEPPSEHAEPVAELRPTDDDEATVVRETGRGDTVRLAHEPVARLTDDERFDRAVPFPLRVFAGWAWRVLIVAGLILAVGWGLRYLAEVMVPLAVATLLTALLFPIARQLKKWRVPSGLAAAISLLGGVIVVVGALTLIGSQIASQAGSLATQAANGAQQFIQWLSTGPIGSLLGVKIDDAQIQSWINQAKEWLSGESGAIANYAAEFGTRLGHFAAGVAITMFSTFFFLFEGRLIWRFLLRFVPRIARRRVDEAARLGWHSLVAFVRATVVVAFVDALGVLIGALLIGVPLAPALAALVFFSAFIPLVGALVSGFVAVAVALVTIGWVKALIMLAVIIGVQQLESHGLQPFLMGRAVAIHPLAIILGIAVGIVVGGIVGALIAVPTMAFAKTFVSHLANSGNQVDLRRHIVV